MTLKPDPDGADENQEALAPPVPMSSVNDLVPPPAPAPPLGEPELAAPPAPAPPSAPAADASERVTAPVPAPPPGEPELVAPPAPAPPSAADAPERVTAPPPEPAATTADAPDAPPSGEPELVAPPAPAPPPTHAWQTADTDLVPLPGTGLVPAGAGPERLPAPYGSSPSTELGPVIPRRRSRKPFVAAAAAVLVAGGVLTATGAFGGGTEEQGGVTPGQRTVAAAPSKGTPDKVPDAADPMAPLPKAHPRVVQPVAGETSDAPVKAVEATAKTVAAKPHGRPKITGPASVGGNNTSDPGVRNLQADKATALPNGVALPPLEAPEAVLDVIRAGNIIARTPYKWGGGHGRFQDNGYDCSGSVSYALYYAGLLDGPHTSGELMAYGKPGPGKWITIYANGGHVYMTVAGIGFDTSAASSANHFSRWRNDLRNNAGFEVRHPVGL